MEKPGFKQGKHEEQKGRKEAHGVEGKFEQKKEMPHKATHAKKEEHKKH
jgi:hypothetical protein